MSGQPLSAATKALMKAAQSDGPSAAARAKVWGGVSGAVGGAAGAGAAGAGAGAAAGGAAGAATGMGAMKMLVLGTLLGGSVTVGLAATMLHIGPSPRDLHPDTVAPVFAAAAAAAGPSALAGIDPRSDPACPKGQAPQATSIAPAVAILVTTAAPTPPVAPRTGPRSAAVHPVSTAAPSHPSPADSLAREASLIADARAALAHGDAQGALRMVRTARALPSPQLVPEELAVEGQALRMMGSADEARGIDQTLRTSYPESALAR